MGSTWNPQGAAVFCPRASQGGQSEKWHEKWPHLAARPALCRCRVERRKGLLLAQWSSIFSRIVSLIRSQ